MNGSVHGHRMRTDSSEAAHLAITAATHICVRTGMDLHLVHCVKTGAPRPDAEPKSEYLEWDLRQLHREAERVRDLGAQMRVHFEHGSRDEALIAVAREVDARLVMIARAAAARLAPFCWAVTQTVSHSAHTYRC